MVDAIKNSCNYYFYEVANRLGIDLINKWCHLLGLDMKTGIEVAGEAQGQIGGQDVLFDNEGSITGVAYWSTARWWDCSTATWRPWSAR